MVVSSERQVRATERQRSTMTTSASPGTYDIRVRGHLDRHWASEFGVPEIVHEDDGSTVLRTVTADQAALYGLLQRLRDLGVTLIAVTLVPSTDNN
jgi:hypothetical protein